MRSPQPASLTGSHATPRSPSDITSDSTSSRIVVGPERQRVAFKYRLQRNDTASEHIRELYADVVGETRELTL